MSRRSIECWLINLQTHLGGGEIYTAFLCRALDKLGVSTSLIHHRDATFWRDLYLPVSTMLHTIKEAGDVINLLPRQSVWVLSQGPLPPNIAQAIAANHLLSGIAHMPPQGRPRDLYEHFHQVFGVSAYVVQGLREIGIPVWESPLYGVADLHRGDRTDEPIRQTSCYDWDRRKGRDFLLGWLEPLIEPLRKRPVFARNPGITIGIVSRLTPIKQFPALFGILAPILVARPNIHLEIFGAGGYASVRDLRHALKPLGNRVRFWGQQKNVASIYRQLDYLITGLPEKEALGLNIIEAQACDTPVWAINAPPFTETVIDGETGFLYCDPRQDNGASFAELLDRIEQLPARLHPAQAEQHLSKFSFDTFVERLQPVVNTIRQELQTQQF
jgi:glycosyltransferase involved in cell wall biosynthesis